GERLELSGRLHYAWISRNDDPSPRLGANDVQPGQALHANFSISYALDPHWRIGLPVVVDAVGADLFQLVAGQA
ncbi:transporter, partial [Pseudomonas aeruginosa]|uniref:transporter n=1 Tax=Pseudomonas aeruginosa TaxID=287 RepID=UPI0024B7CF72